MFPHQVTFCFCRRFHIEFLKIPSSAEHHFNILQLVKRPVQFRGLKESCVIGHFQGFGHAAFYCPEDFQELQELFGSCRTDLFLELVIAGYWQSCRTVLSIPGDFYILWGLSCCLDSLAVQKLPGIVRSCRTVIVL